MKAKRRVVTSGGKASGSAKAASGKRRPTVRKIKPAIAPVTRKLVSTTPVAPSAPDTNGSGPRIGSVASAAAPLGRDAAVDLSVDLGRGLVLDNPILVA